MWFDFLVILVLFSFIGGEVARGGKAISPTRTAILIASGLFAFAVPVVLDRFGIPHTPLAVVLITLIIVNILFIIPAIAGQAIIAAAVSGFLLAFVLQFIPQFIPSNSYFYPLFSPLAHKAYLLAKPVVDKYIATLSYKLKGIRNIDPSKVKPTLPGKGTGGPLRPTLP